MKLSRADDKEIIRLYNEDDLTMKRIGEIFGVGEHVVRYRLKKPEFKLAGGVSRERVQKDRLEELYNDSELPVTHIAAAIGTYFERIKSALELYGIPERQPLSLNGKYKLWMRGLAVGDSREIEARVEHPYSDLHQAARSIKIKISVKGIGAGKFVVRRIG